MIRSSKHSLKFANKGKRDLIKDFVSRYKIMVNKYVNIIWNKYKDNYEKLTRLTSLLDNNLCKTIITNANYDSRIRQCAAKQACSMVKSALTKHNKRLFKLAQLQKEGKDTKYLQRKISFNFPKKPNTQHIKVELDPRFVDFQKGNCFDLFIRITQIGNKQEIKIPIKLTKVSEHWNHAGTRKTSIRLTNNQLVLFYEVENTKKTEGKTVGADQGILTCLSLSDNQVTTKDKHNHDLNSILNILARRKPGSKGFARTVALRKNYINWSINQLNFDNIKEVKLEKIKDLRKGKSSSKKLSHWMYTLIKNKLVLTSEVKGFQLTENDNKFMSQRCSQCGWTHKSNRKGKTFKCTNANCNFVADSDLNAASNHEIELYELPYSVWYKHLNHSSGFYWSEDGYVCGDERIVRQVQETQLQCFST